MKMLIAHGRREEVFLLGLEVDRDVDAGRHVTCDALVLHGGGEIVPICAVLLLVALKTGSREGRLRISRTMGIVAGDARHFGLLEAQALPQTVNLIGDVVVFRMARRMGAIVVRQRLSRTVAERRSVMLECVGVALGADFDLALPCELRGNDNRLSVRCFGMGAVKRDVLASGTVTFFRTSHRDESPLARIDWAYRGRARTRCCGIPGSGRKPASKNQIRCCRDRSGRSPTSRPG